MSPPSTILRVLDQRRLNFSCPNLIEHRSVLPMIGAVGRSTTPHSVFGLLLLDLASSEFFLSSFEDLQTLASSYSFACAGNNSLCSRLRGFHGCPPPRLTCESLSDHRSICCPSMIRTPHYPASPRYLLVHTSSNLLTTDRTIRSRVHPHAHRPVIFFVMAASHSRAPGTI